jgi:hypothetical protein
MDTPCIRIAADAPSIYDGHKANIEWYRKSCYKGLHDDTVIVLAHDDIQILSDNDTLIKYLELCNKPGVGFVGVAGSTAIGDYKTVNGWWAARNFGRTRGFVFQGKDEVSMTPNYFGVAGQVVVLDGCFLACSYKTLKTVGIDKPSYLSSDWDFYDMHLTMEAYLQGLNNYAAPIIIRHESPGNMRDQWFTARDEFFKRYRNNLPIALPMDKTHGLPH